MLFIMMIFIITALSSVTKTEERDRKTVDVDCL